MGGLGGSAAPSGKSRRAGGGGWGWYRGTSEVGAGRGGAKASGGQRCEHVEDEMLKMKVFLCLHLTWRGCALHLGSSATCSYGNR